jgi:hypothetical protein
MRFAGARHGAARFAYGSIPSVDSVPVARFVGDEVPTMMRALYSSEASREALPKVADAQHSAMRSAMGRMWRRPCELSIFQAVSHRSGQVPRRSRMEQKFTAAVDALTRLLSWGVRQIEMT